VLRDPPEGFLQDCGARSRSAHESRLSHRAAPRRSAGRGGVPPPGRDPSPGGAGPLLSHAGVPPRRRRCRSRNAAEGVAWSADLWRAGVVADVALPGGDERLPGCAAAAFPSHPASRIHRAGRSRRHVLADVREPIWLEPCPTAGLHDFSSDPAARYELRESLSLAFAAALQDLAPRQRAALLLRDVLGWSTAETAKALRTTVQAVNSALQRARQAVKTRRLDGGRVLRELPRTHHELIDRFLQAWEAGDAGALARLLTEDATMTMPPSPSWYAGRQAVAGFFAQRVFQGPLAGRLYPVPAEANFLPALAIYRDDETAGRREAFAIIVLVLRGEQVAWMAGFADASLFCPFGLPLVMPRTGGPPGRAQASAPTPQDSPPPTRG